MRWMVSELLLREFRILCCCSSSSPSPFSCTLSLPILMLFQQQYFYVFELMLELLQVKIKSTLEGLLLRRKEKKKTVKKLFFFPSRFSYQLPILQWVVCWRNKLEGNLGKMGNGRLTMQKSFFSVSYFMHLKFLSVWSARNVVLLIGAAFQSFQVLIGALSSI